MIFVSFEQPSNKESGITFTLDGILTPVNELQPSKADVPMDDTVSGKVTAASYVHPLKALAAIDVTPSGIVYEPAFAFGQIINSNMSLL